MTYDIRNPGPGLGQKCSRVKQIYAVFLTDMGITERLLNT